MGDEDAAANLVHQCCHIGSYQLFIVCPSIGRDLAEELLQRFCRLRELAAVIIIRPNAHSEIFKPELVICRCLDGFVHRAASGTAPARLVYQVGAESPAQEKGGKTFPSIWRGFPRLGGLPGSVQEYKRVQGLAIRFQRLVRVVSARLRFNRTAYQETALLTDGQDTVIRHLHLCL